jgi:hypothetical protein
MLKKFLITSTLVALILVPATSFAKLNIDGTWTEDGTSSSVRSSSSSSSSSCDVPKTLQELFAYGICLLNSGIIPFLLGLGLVIFLIGVVGYVRAGDNEEKRQAGRDLMIFGIVALFVMVAVWGLVKILYTTFIGGDFSVNSNAPTGLK